MRLAILEDAGFLAAARNDNAYRAAGLRGMSSLLDGVAMGAWLSSGRLWVIEDQKVFGMPVGFVRQDQMDSPGGDVTVFVLPHHQNRGYGTGALKIFREEHPRARALIRKDNAKSQKVFEHAGFQFYKDQGDGVVVYLGSPLPWPWIP